MRFRLLGALLFLGGVFSFGLVFKGDPCQQEGWPFGIVLGATFFGALAYALVSPDTSRPWIPWAVAVPTTVVIGVGVFYVAVIEWVSKCSN